MDELEQTVGQARELAEERRWGAAALAWARAAVHAAERDDRAAAHEAWDAAGEAWRRDDQPQAASRALGRALDLAHGDPVATALTRVKLAGVLSELGRFDAAMEQCRQAASCERLALRLVALDGWIAALRELGLKSAFREQVRALWREAEGPLAPAAWFRQGQLHRLDGQLGEAETCFARVVVLLESRSGAESGLGAAESELAETALLRGEVGHAIALHEQALAHHEAAGRRALRLQAVGARVRAMVEAGVPVLVNELDRGIAWAAERSLEVLVAELLLSRGIALAVRDPARARRDLDRAIRLTDTLGAPFRAGRARYERATRVLPPGAEAASELAVAEEQLAMSEPWKQRARSARARCLADVDPSAAADLAARCAAHFSAMGMARDESGALELLGQLG